MGSQGHGRVGEGHGSRRSGAHNRAVPIDVVLSKAGVGDGRPAELDLGPQGLGDEPRGGLGGRHVAVVDRDGGGRGVGAPTLVGGHGLEIVRPERQGGGVEGRLEGKPRHRAAQVLPQGGGMRFELELHRDDVQVGARTHDPQRELESRPVRGLHERDVGRAVVEALAELRGGSGRDAGRALSHHVVAHVAVGERAIDVGWRGHEVRPEVPEDEGRRVGDPPIPVHEVPRDTRRGAGLPEHGQGGRIRDHGGDRRQDGRRRRPRVHGHGHRDPRDVPGRVLGLEGQDVGSVGDGDPGPQEPGRHDNRRPEEESEGRGARARSHEQAVFLEVGGLESSPPDVHGAREGGAREGAQDVREGRRDLDLDRDRRRWADVPRAIHDNHGIATGSLAMARVRERGARDQARGQDLPVPSDAIAGDVRLRARVPDELYVRGRAARLVDGRLEPGGGGGRVGIDGDGPQGGGGMPRTVVHGEPQRLHAVGGHGSPAEEGAAHDGARSRGEGRELEGGGRGPRCCLEDPGLEVQVGSRPYDGCPGGDEIALRRARASEVWFARSVAWSLRV